MRVPHDHHIYHSTHIGCSFKFILKVGVEELIVNAPVASRRAKTQTTQKVRLDLNNNNSWCVHNRPFTAYFEDTFK
jgi:hypothetical protein